MLLIGDIVEEISEPGKPLTIQSIDNEAESVVLIDENGHLSKASATLVQHLICLDDFVCWQHVDGKACCGRVNNIQSNMAQIAPLLEKDDVSYLLVSHCDQHLLSKLTFYSLSDIYLNCAHLCLLHLHSVPHLHSSQQFMSLPTM
jgi:hypothetical protein